MNGVFNMNQIQTEPCSEKGLKNFKSWTKNAIFSYFRHI